MLEPNTNWHVYSPVRGMVPSNIVSDTNPPVALRGFVADYDSRINVETAIGFINQLDPRFFPTFYEESLSGKARLVWVFEREILVVDNRFAGSVWSEFVKQGKLDTLLPGFDRNSLKPAERWTNGGVWYEINKSPIEWSVCQAVTMAAGRSLRPAQEEVPLANVIEEMNRRFPNRWEGEFALDAVGVRFWDDTADAPAGCQVKPDGMLCFTGSVPFMSWADIFGRAWVDSLTLSQRAEAADGVVFDGRMYWTMAGGVWQSRFRDDIKLLLQARGMSATRKKGQELSDCDAALLMIQEQNRVDGAAPLAYFSPGVVEVEASGTRLLNISRMKIIEPTPGEFPFINDHLDQLFRDDRARAHFEAHLARAYRCLVDHNPAPAQSIFLCGPKNNGKTLTLHRIVEPILGGCSRQPYQYLIGATNFSDELFSAAMWSINDEEAPPEHKRAAFLQKLKSIAVNPTHVYHAKFATKLTIPAAPRLYVSLNDDPQSVSLLPEVNDNTQDKMMFFRTHQRKTPFPPKAELEATIANEIPAYLHHILNREYPKGVVVQDRMGVASFYDESLLRVSRQQLVSFNLRELLQTWVRKSDFWVNNAISHWEGTPTDLMSEIASDPIFESVIKEWTVGRIHKQLIALARIPESGVEYTEGSTRVFVISKADFIANPEEL